MRVAGFLNGKEVLKQTKALGGVTRKAGQQLTCTGLGSSLVFFVFSFPFLNISRKPNRGDCLKIKESLICLMVKLKLSFPLIIDFFVCFYVVTFARWFFLF